MKTYLSSIASLLFVVLGCIQALMGAIVPDFTVAANPVAVQLHVGKTATSEISLSSDNGFYGSVELACQNLPPALEILVDELIVQAGELDPVEDRLLEDMFRGVVKIRHMALNESINQLRFLQEEAQRSGDGDLRADSYRQMVQRHTMLLRSLDQAQSKQNGRRKEG